MFAFRCRIGPADRADRQGNGVLTRQQQEATRHGADSSGAARVLQPVDIGGGSDMRVSLDIEALTTVGLLNSLAPRMVSERVGQLIAAKGCGVQEHNTHRTVKNS